MADWNGAYKIAYSPDTTGTWTVKPWWVGDTYNNGTQGTPITFTVNSATPPPSTPPQGPPGTIVPGVSDAYIYAGIIVVIAIFVVVLLAVWLATGRKQASKKQ